MIAAAMRKSIRKEWRKERRRAGGFCEGGNNDGSEIMIDGKEAGKRRGWDDDSNEADNPFG